jgi:hypothetical protein
MSRTSVLSIVSVPQGVVAGAIGDRHMNETQTGRRHDGRGRPRIATPRQNVEHNVGGMDPLAQRLGAGRFDFGHAVGQHGGENLDHLAVAVVGAR